ncbi:MAG: 50S ribosomal protein L25 [Elusimicrobiota bacterium]
MEKISIRAEFRPQKSTKKVLSDLRNSTKVPGVVYGGGGQNLHVVVAGKELAQALRAHGSNVILSLVHEKGEETVIVRELQRHVVSGSMLHVDFQRVDLRKKIEVKVPVRVLGEASGVKNQGGVLEHLLREVAVRGLPGEIPQKIEVDVTPLDVGHGLLVKDLKIPAGLEVLESPDRVVVNVVHAMKEEEVAPAAAEVGVEGAEPEVIARGKKEEGEEGEAAPAEKGGKPGAAAPAEKGGKPGAAKPGEKAAAPGDKKAAAPGEKKAPGGEKKGK